MKPVALFLGIFLLARLVEYFVDLLLYIAVGSTISSLPILVRALLFWNFYLSAFLVYARFDVEFAESFLEELFDKDPIESLCKLVYLTLLLSVSFFLAIVLNKIFGPSLVGNGIEVLLFLSAVAIPTIVVRSWLKKKRSEDNKQHERKPR